MDPAGRQAYLSRAPIDLSSAIGRGGRLRKPLTVPGAAEKYLERVGSHSAATRSRGGFEGHLAMDVLQADAA